MCIYHKLFRQLYRIAHIVCTRICCAFFFHGLFFVNICVSCTCISYVYFSENICDCPRGSDSTLIWIDWSGRHQFTTKHNTVQTMWLILPAYCYTLKSQSSINKQTKLYNIDVCQQSPIQSLTYCYIFGSCWWAYMYIIVAWWCHMASWNLGPTLVQLTVSRLTGSKSLPVLILIFFLSFVNEGRAGRFPGILSVLSNTRNRTQFTK